MGKKKKAKENSGLPAQPGTNECQLNKPPFHQCCCSCIHQKELINTLGEDSAEAFVCTNFIDNGVVMLSESKHSCGCECYEEAELYTETEEYEPCPYCGSGSIETIVDDDNAPWHYCASCGASVGKFGWNTRSVEAAARVIEKAGGLVIMQVANEVESTICEKRAEIGKCCKVCKYAIEETYGYLIKRYCINEKQIGEVNDTYYVAAYHVCENFEVNKFYTEDDNP